MEHGIGRYANERCRCDTCRTAWNDYMRDYRARRAGRRSRRGRVRSMRVELTALGVQLAEAWAERTGARVSDVVERALRQYAA